MKNTILSKTLTASLREDPKAVFAWISDPANLPAWYPAFCRALHRENGALIVDSPGGPVRVRFIREDRARVLDILVQVSDGIELIHAIRLLDNGEGSEMIWTLVKPQGLSDSAFHQQLRWAGSALHDLRKMPVFTSLEKPPVPVISEPAETAEPLPTLSVPELGDVPLSGRKLFIGNLSYAWTDEELRAHCAETGAVVTAEVARFRGRGGRSRGFGFVEMATDADAQAAIAKLHGGLAGGRQIIVRLAKSQESRPVSSESRKSQKAADVSPSAAAGAPPSRTARGVDRPRSDRARRGGRSRPAGTGRSYPAQDIQNKSGYEIFPRGSSRKSEASPSSPTPSRPTREASPYMEDTGDIENHGRRPPRRGA